MNTEGSLEQSANTSDNTLYGASAETHGEIQRLEAFDNGERVTWGRATIFPPAAEASAWTRDAEDTDNEESVYDSWGFAHRSLA